MGSARRIVALTTSVILHAAVLASLLPLQHRALSPALPPVEVELVQQPAEQNGAPPPPQPPPAASAAPSTPAAASPSSPPLPEAPQAPAPSAAASPSPPAPPASARPAPSEVNLGNAPRDFDPLIVTGDNVVPPAPDARYRNLPPHYPPAAARIGAEGTVQLLVRVGPAGQPLDVAVAETSGNADLDAEARRAVLLWHFRPARVGRQAVPYDYVLNIRFTRDR